MMQNNGASFRLRTTTLEDAHWSWKNPFGEESLARAKHEEQFKMENEISTEASVSGSIVEITGDGRQKPYSSPHVEVFGLVCELTAGGTKPGKENHGNVRGSKP